MNFQSRRGETPKAEPATTGEESSLGSGHSSHKNLCVIEWRAKDSSRPIIAGYNQGRQALPVFITGTWARVPVDVAALLVSNGSGELIRPQIQADDAQAAGMGLFPVKVADAIIACIKTRDRPFEFVLDLIEFRTLPAKFETTWKAILLPITDAAAPEDKP